MEFQPLQRRSPRHPKFDAIHRALLSGLLSNIGTKSDTYEYLGPRSIRFSIFPGSGQFTEKPKWLVAGELVETTKLYARTCAGVQPQWIERAAAHLVERSYSEPRWDAKTASAICTEKVSLYGLVLVPARTVPFGPINPKIARELFLHHGLVLGEMKNDASFYRHNTALIAEVEKLEAKIRQRNLLADISTRFTFYDAHVPLDIHNGPQFDSWRHTVEKQNPRLLFMNKADLLRADAPPITPDNYPDRLADSLGPPPTTAPTAQAGLRLPLTYRFEPGERDDGLTLAIPLAALPQLRPARYEWLVPGMLEEKIAALLRALPGALRRNFVPVPDWSKAAAAALREQFMPSPKPAVSDSTGNLSQPSQPPSLPETSLREALAAYLQRHTPAPISPADFKEAELPDYLRMNFKVLDDSGKILATARDLSHLQRKLAPHAAGAFATLHDPRFNRDNITAWDFGDLPDSLTIQRFGMSIVAHPALVDHETTCSLRLMPSSDAAHRAHIAGVRRLFRIEYRRDVKSLANALPDYGRMALQYYLLGPTEELKQDLAILIIDRALFAEDPAPRKQEEYLALKHKAATRLTVTAERVARLVADILQQYHYVSLLIDETRAAKGGVGAMGAALAEVHDQLVFLLPRHFLLTTPYDALENFPRYLAAMRLRLEKLKLGGANVLDRDEQSMATITPWWNAYLQRRDEQLALHKDDPELDRFRWMLEEFRVAQTAQELGTVIPISARRLEKQWEKVAR